MTEADRNCWLDLRPYANTAPYTVNETASIQVSYQGCVLCNFTTIPDLIHSHYPTANVPSVPHTRTSIFMRRQPQQSSGWNYYEKRFAARVFDQFPITRAQCTCCRCWWHERVHLDVADTRASVRSASSNISIFPTSYYNFELIHWLCLVYTDVYFSYQLVVSVKPQARPCSHCYV